jgi:hypothetical protein
MIPSFIVYLLFFSKVYYKKMSKKIEAAMRAVGIDEKIISDVSDGGIDDGEIEYFQEMVFDEFKT